MENTFELGLSGQRDLSFLNKSKSDANISANEIPTLQGLLDKANSTAFESTESLKWSTMDEQNFQKEIESLPTLLQKDKAKAQRLIGQLVSSAKEIKNTLTHTLTSVPIHPYERLIYDYLGSGFVPATIYEYSVPEQFNPILCLRELEKISRKTSQVEMTHYACISAEALKPGFNGSFDTENLNNIFAVPTIDEQGKQTFVVDKKRLTEHLKFVEMAKRIPADYIVKNPLAVAKVLISEFIRIHKTDDLEFNDELVTNNIAMNLAELKDLMKTPTADSLKEIFGRYKELNGASNEYDELFNSLIETSRQKELQLLKNQLM